MFIVPLNIYAGAEQEMTSNALEERINKIRMQNEEIRRRYEEVEADKKIAAELEALAEPIPQEDWPVRKEPPEFSPPPSTNTNNLRNPARKQNDQVGRHKTANDDVKMGYLFRNGEGAPPDPGYNFLADTERDQRLDEFSRDAKRNWWLSTSTRGTFKRRGSGGDWRTKDHWNYHRNSGDATRPDYEAWRAERNRIDDARIRRQRTAEGNWRREWDNDKVNPEDGLSMSDHVATGDAAIRHEHGENDKLYRSHRTVPRYSQQSNTREYYHESPGVETPEERVTKSSVVSVKVSPANIAGTGRVGPRQRPRVMYRSSSDVDASTNESKILRRPKSPNAKSNCRVVDQTGKSTSSECTHGQRKRNVESEFGYSDNRIKDGSDNVGGVPKSAPIAAGSRVYDSGFIELPRNDDVRDVAGNLAADLADNRRIDDDLVMKQNFADATVAIVGEEPIRDSVETTRNSSTNVNKDRSDIAIDFVDSSSILRASENNDITETIGPDGGRNHLQNKADDASEL